MGGRLLAGRPGAAAARCAVRTVSTSALLAGATSLDERPNTTETGPFVLPAVALAGLSATQRREVDRKVEQLRPLLEPLPDGGSRTEQIAAHARTVGVSVRTLERRLERFEALGPAGLVDARLLKDTRREVDPLWDTACTEVLDDEGLLGEDAAYAQTSRRATRCEVARFTVATDAGGRAWVELLRALEGHVKLADARAGHAHRPSQGTAPPHPGAHRVTDQPDRPGLLPGRSAPAPRPSPPP